MSRPTAFAVRTLKVLSEPLMPLVWLGAVAIHYLRYFDPERPLLTDIRYYVYFALQTSHGAVPYLEFFDLKTPLATMVGASLASIGSVFDRPLATIRVGYLLIAATTAVALGGIQSRLFGTLAAGVAGTLLVCAFPLIGTLASIGNVPKLLMHLAAVGAAWCAMKDYWALAGAVAALAFLDWQVGGLVAVGVLLAAAQRDRRWSCVVSASLGLAAGLLPFIFYFSAAGALTEAVNQTLVESFTYGTSAGDTRTLGEHLRWLALAYRSGAPSREWIAAFAMMGVLASPILAWRARTTPEASAWIVLLTLHGGVVAFSAIDFQWFGDLLALLLSIAFFAAVSVNLLARGVQRARARRGWRVPGEVTVFVGAILACTPVYPLIPLGAESRDLALHDQRDLGESLLTLTGREVAMFNHSELAILAPFRVVLPFVYWDGPAATHFSDASRGGPDVALAQVLARAGYPPVIADAASSMPPALAAHYCERVATTANGRYGVRVWLSPAVRCQATVERR